MSLPKINPNPLTPTTLSSLFNTYINDSPIQLTQVGSGLAEFSILDSDPLRIFFSFCIFAP